MAKKTVDFVGTVSEATMRPEDLIPAFTEVLEQYWPEKAKELADEYSDIYAAMDGDDDVYLSELDGTDWLLDSLFDALEEIAPDGFTFGAHPGDGSDYGFWAVSHCALVKYQVDKVIGTGGEFEQGKAGVSELKRAIRTLAEYANDWDVGDCPEW